VTMGRRLREQPRVVVAWALGLVALALAVALVTAVLSDGGDDSAALERAERREADLSAQLRNAERALAESEADLERASDLAGGLRQARQRVERENRRLVRQTRRLRRALNQTGVP
jgi:chromosome segregation ATPase